jgi:phosphoserine phosphatase RsbU/P
LTTAEGQVLVVHPAAARRDLLCRRLQEAGYAARPVADDADALKLVQAEEPDVVVLGVDCCTADSALALIVGMQANSVTRAIPVIALAPRDADLLQRCLDAGAADYLQEPHSPSALKALVEEYRAISVRRRQDLRRAEREDLLKIERDVQIARQIQEGFLPDALPQPAGWDTAARFHPAREVAGDFYDGFELSQGRRVALVIADVCDKGVGAALFMALFRSLYRAYAQQNYSMRWTDVMTSKMSGDSARQRAAPQTGSAALKNAMDLTNKYMTEVHAAANMFATTFFAVLDPASGQLAYVNGGHNPPVVLGPDGAIKARLKPTGPAVGLFPDVEYRIEQVKLEPGDVLFTFTDGVTDARDPRGKQFGEPRMLDLVTQPCASASGLLDRVDDAVRTHIGSASQFDDITMLALRRSPEA